MFVLNAVSAIKGMALACTIVNTIVIAGVLVCLLLLLQKTVKAANSPKARDAEASPERQGDTDAQAAAAPNGGDSEALPEHSDNNADAQTADAPNDGDSEALPEKADTQTDNK